jgi:hypothetical protein
MAKPPRISGVDSALEDLISLEKERIRKEDEARRAKEAEERNRREAEEKRRRDEEERRRRSEEAARLAKQKAERDERERKENERKLQEFRMKGEIDMQRRLQEQKLRLDHEKELMQIEVLHRKRFPRWATGLIVAVFVIGASAAGVALYTMKSETDRAAREKQAILDQAAKKEKARKEEILKLHGMLTALEQKVTLSEEEKARQAEIRAEIEKLENAAAADVKGGKKVVTTRPTNGKGGEQKDLFNMEDDPLANIEDDLGSSSKDKKKKKKKHHGSSKGPTLDLDDPTELL